MDSSTVKLDSLEKEYIMVLQQYEVAYNDYIDNLKNNSNTSDTSFVSLQGRTYWGTGGIQQGYAETSADCESMCSSDLKCSGATFNADRKYCWTRSGEGKLTNGKDNDYALIPKVRQNLFILKHLNQKLLDINGQINTELEMLIPSAQSALSEKDGKQQELNRSYASLLKEQKELELMFKEYETLNEQLTNNELYVNQQNSSVKFWILLGLIVLIITIKQMTGLGGTGGLLAVVIGIILSIYITIKYS